MWIISVNCKYYQRGQSYWYQDENNYLNCACACTMYMESLYDYNSEPSHQGFQCKQNIISPGSKLTFKMHFAGYLMRWERFTSEK